MVVLRSGAAEQDDVRLLGEGAATDDIHTGHIGGDIAAVDQKAPCARIVRPDVVGGQRRRGDHLVGPDVHPGRRQRTGDLRPGHCRGVGQVRAGDPLIVEKSHCLGGPRDGLPRGHQHTVDVEEHSADGHVQRLGPPGR